jgi:hypothetical protein
LFAAVLTDRDPIGNGQPVNPVWPTHIAGAGAATKKLPDVLLKANVREL